LLDPITRNARIYFKGNHHIHWRDLGDPPTIIMLTLAFLVSMPSNPLQQSNLHEREWFGDYIIPLI